MIATTSYPFLEVFWTMLIFFAFVIWIWILITVLIDIFRRHDTSGFAKVLWIIFIIVLPYLGVFVYLIVEHNGHDRTGRSNSSKPPSRRWTSTSQSVAGQTRPGRADRQGQGAAGRRHDLPDRVRSDQAEGAGERLARNATMPSHRRGTASQAPVR